jgi:hypothetical protein
MFWSGIVDGLSHSQLIGGFRLSGNVRLAFEAFGSGLK